MGLKDSVAGFLVPYVKLNTTLFYFFFNKLAHISFNTRKLRNDGM